jgi:hypothetical protein
LFQATAIGGFFQQDHSVIDTLISNLRLDAEARPRGKYATIVVKPFNGRTVTATQASDVEALRAALIGAGMEAVTVMNVSNMDLKSQVKQMLNTSVAILPGGGIGFIATFIAKGSHAIIAAYPNEGISFSAASGYSKLDFFDLLPNGSYPISKLLSLLK